MRIVNFAGSFDPIHDGHISMVKEAFEALKPDLFYITPISRSFTKKYSTTYAQRAHMIELALSSLNNEKIKVNYCEQDIPEGYSGYKHINDLRNYTHADELYVVIGADHLPDLQYWDEINWLKEHVIFYVFARRNIQLTPFAKELINSGHLVFNYDFDFEVGSYQQRVLPTFLDPKVVQYINQHGLYAFQRLITRMKQPRAAHSFRVAQLAKEYALLQYPELAQKAYLAGLYHDWCKESKDEEICMILKDTKFEKDLNKFHKINVLHGPAAAIMLQKQLYFNDDEILHAIINHTIIFDPNITQLDKILYVADKLELKRTEEDLANIEQIRELAKKDVNVAFDYIHHYQVNKFKHLRRE